MPKKPPDHREQLEVKFARPERENLELLAGAQVGKAAGGVIAGIGQGFSNVVTPFLNGGDAGLIGAWIASLVIDQQLDDRAQESLENYIGNISNPYEGIQYGPAPAPVMTENGYVPTLIICDPADFGAIPSRCIDIPTLKLTYRWTQENEDLFGVLGPLGNWSNQPRGFMGLPASQSTNYWYRTSDRYMTQVGGQSWPGWEIVLDQGTGMLNPGFYVEEVDTLRFWTESEKNAWVLILRGQNELGNAWRRLIGEDPIPWVDPRTTCDAPWQEEEPARPALTLNDPITYEDVERWGLLEKYGVDGNHEAYTFVWNTNLQQYISTWQSLSLESKLEIYSALGGKGRIQTEDLDDILSALNVSIPGMGALQTLVGGVENVVEFAGDAVSAVTNLDETFAGLIQSATHHYYGGGGSSSSGTVQPLTRPPLPPWPKKFTPPKSIYRFAMIHRITEHVKILIPWYIGAKFTIQAAGAFGEILPG